MAIYINMKQCCLSVADCVCVCVTHVETINIATHIRRLIEDKDTYEAATRHSSDGTH